MTAHRYDAYPARSREDVERDHPVPYIRPANDDRGRYFGPNPNTSSALWGIRADRYLGARVVSKTAEANRKAREEAWVERSFRTTGLVTSEARRSGRSPGFTRFNRETIGTGKALGPQGDAFLRTLEA